jgi:hypothetical protein
MLLPTVGTYLAKHCALHHSKHDISLRSLLRVAVRTCFEPSCMIEGKRQILSQTQLKIFRG